MARERIAAELYSAPPGEFVAQRDEAVRALRASGDRKLAAEVAKWRKPVVAAWVVNLLAVERGDELTSLVDLGAALAEAQRRGDGTELRRLTTEKQRLLQSLVRDGRALAAEAGQPVGIDVGHEVEGTLNAAVADADAAERVLSGRLLRPETYAGFGPLPDGDRPHLTVVADQSEADRPPARRLPSRKPSTGESAPASRGRSGGAAQAGAAKAGAAPAKVTKVATAEQKAAERKAAALARVEEAAAEAESELAEAEERRSAAKAEADTAAEKRLELEERAEELRDQLAKVERGLNEAGLDRRRLARAADRTAIEVERARTRLAAARRQVDRHR